MPITPSASIDFPAKSSHSTQPDDPVSVDGHDSDSGHESSDWILASTVNSISVGDGRVGVEMQNDLETYDGLAILTQLPLTRALSSTATSMSVSLLPGREVDGDFDWTIASRDDDDAFVAPLRLPENVAVRSPFEQDGGLDDGRAFEPVRLDDGGPLEHVADLDNSLSSGISAGSESIWELISYSSFEGRSV